MGTPWPNPRFTINESSPGGSDGTVTDNLTGLIWLRDASCLGEVIWADALTMANALFDGCAGCGGTDNDCGLSDGSQLGEWRLPNLRELDSLVDYVVTGPAIPDTSGASQWSNGNPFWAVPSSALYWSSTTLRYSPVNAWGVTTFFGKPSFDNKAMKRRVWPVRGGQ